MPALPAKGDIRWRGAKVSFVPILLEKSTSSDRANNQSRIDRLKVETGVPL
jgi:hypothetical protein